MRIDTEDLPKSFGPYTLREKFAGGGMAEIYLAEAEGPGGFVKPLIIKTIHRDYSADPRFVAMFTEEAKILSRLTHGNIVPIFDFGTVGETLYLAMEFIDGVDVATLIEVCRNAGFNIPPALALHVGIGTAAALSHAHQVEDGRGKSLSIVHRDVSPQNILIGRSGEVKLCDFGLAVRSRENAPGEGAADEIKGKLKYLSPEQALGETVDFRSDIFSLGVVLFELVVGHHPIPSESGVSVLRTLTGTAGYPATAEVAPWVSEAVCAVVDRALRFEKTERFESAEEMRAALDRCRHRVFPEFSPETAAALVVRVQAAVKDEGANGDGNARRRPASFAAGARSGRRSGREPLSMQNRRRWVVIAAVLLLVGGGAAWALYRGGERARGGDASERPAGSEESFGVRTSSRDTGASSPVAADAATIDTAGSEAMQGGGTNSEGGPSGQGESEVRETASDTSETTGDTAPSGVGDRRPGRAVRGFGTVNINASPWADVTVDGVRYTSTPILGVRLRAGRHKIVLRNDALGVTRTRVITVSPDETQTVVVEMIGE